MTILKSKVLTYTYVYPRLLLIQHLVPNRPTILIDSPHSPDDCPPSTIRRAIGIVRSTRHISSADEDSLVFISMKSYFLKTRCQPGFATNHPLIARRLRPSNSNAFFCLRPSCSSSQAPAF